MRGLTFTHIHGHAFTRMHEIAQSRMHGLTHWNARTGLRTCTDLLTHIHGLRLIRTARSLTGSLEKVIPFYHMSNYSLYFHCMQLLPYKLKLERFHHLIRGTLDR